MDDTKIGVEMDGVQEVEGVLSLHGYVQENPGSITGFPCPFYVLILPFPPLCLAIVEKESEQCF